MLTLIILLNIFLVLAILHLVHLQFYWKRKNVKNSFKASTIENFRLFFLQTNVVTLSYELYCKTKEKYVGFFIMGTPSILIKDLSLIKRILVKDFDNFSDRTMASNKKDDPLGTRTLFVEKNPEWKFVRAKTAFSFSSGKMRSVYPQMCGVADNFVEHLFINEGKAVAMADNCAKYATDLITNCSFGMDENSFENDKTLSREASRKIFPFNILRGFQFSCYFISPFLVKLFNMKWLDPGASSFVRNLFYAIKERRSREGPNDDYVGLLIKLYDQNIFHSDPQEIIAQAASVFLAGFETIGSTLQFLLYEVANRDDIQHNIRESIKNHIQSTNNELTYESLMNVEILMNVIHESMRKYSVLPFVDRKVKADYYIPEDDLTIDAGTNIYISLIGIHRDPAYYPDPMKFDPDRFSKENKHNIIPNSFLPFGDGPRNCIGARLGKLALAVALAKIVQNFKLSLPYKFEELEFDPRGFLLSPTRKISIIFHKI